MLESELGFGAGIKDCESFQCLDCVVLLSVSFSYLRRFAVVLFEH